MDEPVKVIRPPARRVTLAPATVPVAPVGEPATGWQAPATLEEAEQRLYDKYGLLLIGALLGGSVPKPETITDWCELAKAVKAVLELRAEWRTELRQGSHERH